MLFKISGGKKLATYLIEIQIKILSVKKTSELI